MQKINYLDLFCGCGGLTEGFEQSGNYNFLGGVDWDKSCVNTLRERLQKYCVNDPNDRVLEMDIRNHNEVFSSFDQLINNKTVDLIVGGPPCQAYSIAGRIRDKDQMKNDYRNFLFESYVKVVDKYKPKFFIFENVPGILTAKPGGIHITKRIYEGFDNIGYQISPDLRKDAIFDLSEYGVPQKRRRVIILGVRKDLSTDPFETLGKFYVALRDARKNYLRKTVKDAIFDLPPILPLKEESKGKRVSHELKSKTISWHVPRFHNERDIKIFKELALDIASGSNKYQDIESIKKLYTKMTGKKSNVHKYYVLRSNEPSNTIVAHLHKDGLRHIHPDPTQARSITVQIGRAHV